MEAQIKKIKEQISKIKELINVKYLIIAFATISAISIISASLIWYKLFHKTINLPQQEHIFTVERGSSIGKVAYQLSKENIISSARGFRWLALLKGDATKIQAGEYRLLPSMNQNDVLQIMVDGVVVNYGFTIIEGRTLQRILSELKEEPKINAILDENNQVDLREGMFWPDTYFYPAGTTDLAILQRSNKLMHTKLKQMWDDRAENSVLKNMYQAVILASIIEKETSLTSEYKEVSGVYHRRLEQRIRLQADPTVIYGLMQKGEFTAPLTRRQLSIDSPYNTYKHYGLPPSPIAIPSPQALAAALSPADGDTLYFVANGEGGHTFSKTLKEHRAAINVYKRKLKKQRESQKNN